MPERRRCVTEQTNLPGIIDFLEQPAFCVQDGKIVACNRSAQNRQITADQEVAGLLGDHSDTYAGYTDGLLYLQLTVDGIVYDATVTRTEQGDIFLLDTRFSNDALQAMALASQHLRTQLGSVMAQAADRYIDPDKDGGIMKGLYRMQRMLCNMSDIPYYRSKTAPSDTLELGAAVYEICEKASTLLEEADYQVQYTGVREPLFVAGDYEMLERAIFNLLSNAAKYSPKGSLLQVTLTRKNNVACISVEDAGQGIDTGLYATLFARYQREPSVGDGQSGIGLGMALVQSVAAYHGGTVLVTRSQSGGTKVALSISLRTQKDAQFRSPVLKLNDYAGGNDHGLLEFSDILPAKMYIH